MRKVSKAHVNHIVGRVSGVKEGDSKVVAAEKAIATMRAVGFPASAIRKAEAILAKLRAGGRT